MSDTMREDFAIMFKCSVCEDTLQMHSGGSKLECNSAMNLSGVISIIPCRSCKTKQDKFKQAFKQMLNEVK